MSKDESKFRQGRTVPRRRFTALAGTAMVMTQAGCLTNRLSSPPVEQVEANIIDVRPPSLGLGTASLTFVLELSNPADRPVPEPTVEFQILISGHPAGTSSTTFSTIEPGGESTERVEVIIEYTEVGGGVAESLETGEFGVQVQGTIQSRGTTARFGSSTHSY